MEAEFWELVSGGEGVLGADLFARTCRDTAGGAGCSGKNHGRFLSQEIL